MNVREIVSYSKQVEKNNVAYKRLGKKGKRLAIAKDALGQLLLGKAHAESGTYFRATLGDDVTGDAKQIADKVLALPECSVCAKGAVMLSQIRHRRESAFAAGGVGIDGDHLHCELGGFDGAFNGSTLDLMETIFEDSLDSYEICKIDDADTRLFAILENIVANDGDFNPGASDGASDLEYVNGVENRFSKARTTATRKRKAA